LNTKKEQGSKHILTQRKTKVSPCDKFLKYYNFSNSNKKVKKKTRQYTIT